MVDNSQKKISDRVLSECRKQFWSTQQKLGGMLSWGEISKLLRETELHLSNGCMNQLYQICDKQKHGCIQFNEFLAVYFRHERKIKPQNPSQPVRDLSADMINKLRREFFDPTRKRYGRLSRVELIEIG